jgi:RNA polymerase sigma-70 factor (ECF subfamily)
MLIGLKAVSKVAVHAPYGTGAALIRRAPSRHEPVAGRITWSDPVSHDAPGPATPDLAALLEQCARGDERAFATLYDATASRAYGVALRVLRDPGLAEEVTQEAYLDLWRHAKRYDRGKASVAAWLLTLVHRRAVDRVRSTEGSTRVEEAYRRRAWPHGDVDSTSDAALASLEARQVRAALARLSPPQRQAIGLAYFDGLSHSEVAAVVGAPLGTVKSRIRDGLQKLRVALDSAAPHAT